MATSHEAQVLLEGMPKAVRSLATSLQTQNERCIGELRGPVLWSETMSARASSFGDRDLFICASPARAYDIDENRVLVAALRVVRDAGLDASDRTTGPLEDPVQRMARRIGGAAAHWLDHPSLGPISPVRPTPRAIRRTRSGKHRKTYQPALDVLDRATEPMTAEEAFRWCRPVVRRRHRLLLGLVERLEHDGRRQVPKFRAEHGALLAGPLVFHAGRSDGAGPGRHHARHPADRRGRRPRRDARSGRGRSCQGAPAVGPASSSPTTPTSTGPCCGAVELTHARQPV